MLDTMLTGAAIFAGGAAFDRLIPGRRRTSAKTPAPFCGCTHHYSFHDPEAGRCHGLMDGKPLAYDAYNNPRAYEQIPCTCRRYSGPVPLPEVFAPPLSGG